MAWLVYTLWMKPIKKSHNLGRKWNSSCEDLHQISLLFQWNHLFFKASKLGWCSRQIRTFESYIVVIVDDEGDKDKDNNDKEQLMKILEVGDMKEEFLISYQRQTYRDQIRICGSIFHTKVVYYGFHCNLNISRSSWNPLSSDFVRYVNLP